MKRFTTVMESGCITSDVNPGNSAALGVTNHLTPLNNIITNVRNLFAPTLGLVVAAAEDGVSLKMHSHAFINKREVEKVINNPLYQNTSVASYIISQGLDAIKLVNLGQYMVVYFSPTDIKTAAPGMEALPACMPCKEMEELHMQGAEIMYITEDNDEGSEIKDVTKKKLKEILSSKKHDAKQAKTLELLVGQEMELPREYYFVGWEDKTGDQSIALRWRYQKKTGRNQITDMTMTLMCIYDTSDKGMFVPPYDKNALSEIPDEVKKLIENLIKFFDAEKTSDPAVFSLKNLESKDDDKKDDDSSDDKKDDDSSDDKKDDSSDDDLLGGGDDSKDKDSGDKKSGGDAGGLL